MRCCLCFGNDWLRSRSEVGPRVERSGASIRSGRVRCGHTLSSSIIGRCSLNRINLPFRARSRNLIRAIIRSSPSPRHIRSRSLSNSIHRFIVGRALERGTNIATIRPNRFGGQLRIGLNPRAAIRANPLRNLSRRFVVTSRFERSANIARIVPTLRRSVIASGRDSSPPIAERRNRFGNCVGGLIFGCALESRAYIPSVGSGRLGAQIGSGLEARSGVRSGRFW